MTTCLIGNGLSIAYNPELSVEALTTGLLQAFGDLQAPVGQEHPLARFAQALHGSGKDSFESLLGLLDSAALALPHLARLADVVRSQSAEDITTALDRTVAFLREVHTQGMGTALELIASRGRGQSESQFNSVILAVCRAIANLRGDGQVAVATLNYDGLLHAGFQRLEDEPHSTVRLCDLAAGFAGTSMCPAGSKELACYGLRRDWALPGNIHLLNLHGSLGWLGDPDSGRVWKFALEDLRSVDEEGLSYWTLLRAGRQRLEPRVVLTDRKDEAVTQWPFSLAYDIFEDRLVRSHRWLIAGYSFGDRPVNCAITRALARRRDSNWGQPRILVLGRPGADAESLHRDVLQRLGAGAPLQVDTTGLPGSVQSAVWQGWASA